MTPTDIYRILHPGIDRPPWVIAAIGHYPSLTARDIVEWLSGRPDDSVTRLWREDLELFCRGVLKRLEENAERR